MCVSVCLCLCLSVSVRCAFCVYVLIIYMCMYVFVPNCLYLSSEKQGARMRIRDVQSSDEGVYKCEASSGVGSPVSALISLQVGCEYMCAGQMMMTMMIDR